MSTSQPSANFRVDIQGMRGIAVLLVVLYHAGLPVPGGFIGVDVFFVLSGFVITEGMLRGLESGKFSFAEFYRKRVRRLLPALALMTTVVLATAWFLGPIAGQHRTGSTGVAATLLNANHYLMRGNGYFEASTEYISLLHTWSLSVEEQFYLVFPLVTVLLWRLGRKSGRPRLLGAGLVVFSLVSLVLCVWLSFKGSVLGIPGLKFAFFSAITRSWEFGIGALLAVASPWIRAQNAWVGRLGWVGLAMVLVSSFAFSEATVFPGYSALLPAFGTGLLLLSGFFGAESPLVRALSMRWLVRLGDLSYSWYLWHWPLIVFAAACFPQAPLRATVCAASASLGVAWASERFWEAPIRYRPTVRQWPAWAVGMLCVASPLGMFIAQDRVFKLPFDAVAQRLAERGVEGAVLLRELESVSAQYSEVNCHTGASLAEARRVCRWDGGDIWSGVLIGDSNSHHHLPAFRQMALETGGTLISTSLGHCPTLDVSIWRDGREISGCREYTDQVLKDVIEDRPDFAFVGNSIDGYVFDARYSVVDRDGSTATSSEEKMAVISASLDRVVSSLVRAGIQVVLLDPVPKFVTVTGDRLEGGPDYGAMMGRCSRAVLILKPRSCDISRSLDGDGFWRNAEVVSQIHSSLRRDGVDVWNINSALCTPRCRSVSYEDSKILYINADHLSPDASDYTAPLFVAELRRLLVSAEHSSSRE